MLKRTQNIIKRGNMIEWEGILMFKSAQYVRREIGIQIIAKTFVFYILYMPLTIQLGILFLYSMVSS